MEIKFIIIIIIIIIKFRKILTVHILYTPLYFY